jgi:hypothetical protein
MHQTVRGHGHFDTRRPSSRQTSDHTAHSVMHRSFTNTDSLASRAHTGHSHKRPSFEHSVRAFYLRLDFFSSANVV